jgi:hypothetical protein
MTELNHSTRVRIDDDLDAGGEGEQDTGDEA